MDPSTGGTRRDVDAATDVAVRNLVGRYCEAVFHFDVAAFRACWHDDAVWGVAGARPIEGIDRIVRVFERLRGPLPRCLQLVASGVVEAGPHAGEVEARWVIRELQWPVEPGAEGVDLYGMYRDTIRVDADGVWRFAARSFAQVARGTLALPPLL